ncbi:hypothetical protein NDU88_005905 [Pleurodeles waltl]|uniref:Uncharacterized protein n=1 Tax=Pleurodeles waltl TaxID=8319 RepID=A0AAV7PGS0_PLEWA|nr:hypothetical protein NDU88_005905 [Pleurodeles waltl]
MGTCGRHHQDRGHTEAASEGEGKALVPPGAVSPGPCINSHEEDLVVLKWDIAADVKDLKKDIGELGQRVYALEQTGDSHEEDRRTTDGS